MSYSSLLGWIFAAVWANYQPTEFLKLSGEEQSLIVAAYNAHNQIEAVFAHEESKKNKRNAPSSSPKVRKYK